jgi:hypothetical protein
MIITTSWILAKCACPSWSSITDESALRSALATLDEFSSSLHRWLVAWTSLVALGVALEVVFVVWEYLDELRDFKRGTIHPPERPRTTLFVLGLLGAVLVAAGVSGELWKESQIAKLETCIRKGNDALFLILSKEAGDAATSATIARREAEAVAKLAAAQGPRAKLLNNVARELAGKLAPFAGQRVGLFVCGRQGTPDQEMLDTWAVVANILGPDVFSGTAGAKWKEVPTNLNFADGCGAARGLGQGVIVFVSKRASRRTMEAANALGHGLAEALPPSPNKMPSLIDPDFTKLVVGQGLRDKNAPWASVGLDPDLITVLVGAHP